MKAIYISMGLCMGLLSAASQAQSVFKCMVGGVATYQESPCEAPPALVSRSGARPLNGPLLGTWRSDHAMTLAWMRRNTTLQKRQESYLDQRIGYLTMTFTTNRLKVDMADHFVQRDGKPFRLAGSHDDLFYSVVAADPKRISISYNNTVNNSAIVSEIHIEGHDKIWIPLGAPRSLAFDARDREYFRRTK